MSEPKTQPAGVSAGTNVGPAVALVHIYVADEDDYGPAPAPEPAAIDRRTASVVAAHLAEYISEGEAARILGIGRIEFREIEDALKQEGEALRHTLKPPT